MATRNVLGKIAAVVSINTGSVRPTLNSTAKDVERFATTVRSRISSATRASGKAFDDIFTPLQKLQAALKAANQQPVDLKIQNGREIQQAVRAAEQIAKPLANARKEFGTLSQGVQASLLPVLQSAQKQATNLFDALSNGAKVSNTDLANTEARVQQLISAFSRAAQASQLIRGLGNGQELQFQNPEFVEQARRSAQLQQQASSLTASQLSGSSIVNLIGQQRAAADEAERLRAALDKVRTTRNGDAAAAQAAYSNQLAQLAGINDRIERQIALIQRAAAAEQSAASARSAAQQQVTAQRNSLASASAALTGGITPQVQDVNEVFSNLTSRAQQARAAVANAFRTPEAADLRNRLAQIAAEVGNIQDEYRTLSAQDPQRREILRWQDLEERVQAVNFRLGAVTSLANQAREALGGVADEFTEAQLQAQRLAAANERLVVDQQESQVLSNEGASSRRATPVPRSVFEEGFARQIRNELGPAITDQQRQFDVLRGSIVSVKGQLDTLPATVRSQFIPAIQQAEAEFQRLRALGPDATAEAIENASNEVDRLGQQLRRVSQVQALPNFAQALDDSAIRGSIGNLNALQQILSRVGAEAGSNAAVQFDRMRAAIQRATADGTIGSQAFQNELREIARDAAAAASATGQIGQDAAFREIQRGGDIARGGFDNLSLAVQQAAFAIDDFFSVQGDFSQRIRAVQNNVTQLAFILGGTTGLFIGLGVSIAAQAVVGLVKWINNGRTAEDQTKALNDALASQKSLVEELAQAFESLGDSITERAFSESTQQARAFAKQLEEIAKQQREIRENRVADLDTGVQRERANQARIQRELQSSSDPARRLVLESELASSRSRERDVRQAAINQRPLPFNQIRDIVLESVRAEANVRSLGRPDPQQVRLQQEAALANLGDGASLERTLEGLRSRLTGLRNSPDANDRGIQQAAVGLERAIAVIESRLNSPLDELTRTVSASSRGLSIELEKAQGDVADAIRRGVPAAAEFQATLDATAGELKSAFDRLSAAQEITDNPGRRESEIRAARQEIARLQQAQDGLNRQARDIRLTSGAGGERTTAALSALQGSERFTNEYGRLIARLRDAVAREEQARTATAAAGQKNDQALLEKARAELRAATAASDLAAATAEAATAMEQAISRVRRIGDDALRGSEQIADDAQRRFTQDPTDANRQARDAAEQQLIRDRERIAQANNALDRARSEAERNDPRVAAVNAELESISQERRRLSDEAAKRGGQVDAAEAERLANREAQLQAERATILDELTQAERRQQDTIAQEIAARLKVIEALEQERRVNEEIRQRERPQGDAVRGLDLLETDAQRSARELAQGLADIQAATSATIKRLREQFEADGVVTRDERDQLEAARRAGEDAQNRFRAANDPFLQEFRRLGLSPRFNETQGGDAVRGLGLSQTPAQRAAAEAEQGIRDIDAAFREIDRRLFERGAGVPELDANEAARQDAIRRFAADQQRATAPALFGLADSVANAVMQGPSRAALNVSDISTQEGARELNRLLRGEDSARDQNLIELQKQSQELAQVNTKLQALANRVGVAL